MERIGQGTLLAVSADAGSTWATVARLETIGEFSMGEYDDIEVTSHDSTSGFKEYIAGLADAGELEVSGRWIADATQRGAVTARGMVRDWRVTLPGGLGIWRSRGYIKNLTINPVREDVISFSVTLKISGAPTLTF